MKNSEAFCCEAWNTHPNTNQPQTHIQSLHRLPQVRGKPKADLRGENMTKYYFVLGKEGSTNQYKEPFKDAKIDLGITALEKTVEYLNEQLEILIEVVGRERIKQYFKELFLRKLEVKCYRRYELVTSSFYDERNEAFNELLSEGKIIEKRGWIKKVKT